jgi:hypothetical protein
VPPSGSLQELVDRVATLDANRLELKVSEIDADAILFFRDGRAPAHRPLRRSEPGRIRTYSKLFGRDVILAYRLLKTRFPRTSTSSRTQRSMLPGRRKHCGWRR